MMSTPPQDTSAITITARGSVTQYGKELLAEIARGKLFLQQIQRIDDDLRDEGIPIPDRPGAAISVAERELGQSHPATRQDSGPARGVFTREELTMRVQRWYEQHYSGALGPAMRIEFEAAFQQHIDQIDRKLREASVPIPGRPIAALLEFSKLTGSELRICSLDREPLPGRYLGDDLSIRVAQWYEERYGDRILMDGKEGQVVVLLRGEPWVMELPLILGGGSGPNFICGFGRATTLPAEPVLYRLGDVPPPSSDYNVLDSIVGLTDGFAKALTSEECETILEGFLVGRTAYSRLSGSSRDGLLALVRGDLDAAVAHLTGNFSQTGLSQWASLQATEKVLKHYLETLVGSYKHGHKLVDLESQAVAAGLPPLDPTWLPAIQCPAGVRYGEICVSVEQAVAAHLASLRVISHVLTATAPLAHVT
jgi:hypothetical protein